MNIVRVRRREEEREGEKEGEKKGEMEGGETGSKNHWKWKNKSNREKAVKQKASS